jgi:Rha family phage regulatory protein
VWVVAVTSTEIIMQNLVRLNTNDITKAHPVASTRTIAKEFGKEHKHILEKVEKLINDDSSTFFTRSKIRLSEYVDDSGKANKEILLDRDQFMFIVMGFTTSKANSVYKLHKAYL